MSVVEDVERVQALLAERGTSEQRAWFASWAPDFSAAVDSADEEACEDLHIALIVFERTVLSPPRRLFTLDEVIVELGFDPADFRDR